MQTTDVRLKRIQWRCRRGTRELDALLQGWFEANAAVLDAAQLTALEGLLDQQDPELWGWLMGHAEAPDAGWRALVQDIRRHVGMAP